MAAYLPERYGPKEWNKRGKAMHRVTERIVKALGPFTPNEILLFNPKKGFSAGGFFVQLYTELPRRLQRKFLLLDEGPAPTIGEYRKLEREILGHARQKLLRELVTRILKIPSKPGRNGGRPIETDGTERLRIRKRIRELMKSGDDGEPMSKRKAIKTLAEFVGYPKERTIWRIVLGH